MSSSFALQFILCALTILQVHSDVITVNGTLGGFVTFHLNYPDLEQLANITWQKENTSLSNRTDRMNTFSNGTLALQNTEKKDEGQYTVSVYNVTGNLVYQRIFQLYVHESTQIPAVHIRCLPGGGGELVCNALDNSSVKVDWSVDGHPLNPTEACITDNGKKIILEKRVTGELVCHTHHGNSTSKSSPIKLSCEEGDLLYQPLFHYILAACGGGAVVLAVIASLITCCCLKSKQQFIPVPSGAICAENIGGEGAGSTVALSGPDPERS
ncbi:T-cell surface antigen CD2-like isoform X3 [Pelodiscus sinensis]|uniref:T-cell surface antigen CD2-like isoform X3 n=1 Tax=Pelodiscus sinensis TaxID=13735 RepID=UPI003F6B6459